MTVPMEGVAPYPPEEVERYRDLGCWADVPLGDLLDRAAERFPFKEALVDQNGRLTFGEVRDRAERLAVSLMALGIEPQERILVQLPNWNEFAVVYFALQKIGAIDVLLIDRYRSYEINEFLCLTGATTWVVPARYEKTDYRSIVQEVAGQNRQLKRVLSVRGEGVSGSLRLEPLLARGDLTPEDRALLRRRRPDPLQVSHLAPTGGTTGVFKVVPRTHNDLFCCVRYATQAWGIGAEDRCLLVGPIGHDLTFTKGFLGTVHAGGTAILLDSRDPESIYRTIEEEKVTALIWVPTLAKRLVDFTGRDRFDLSTLKSMHCGGGISPPELIEAVEERLGCTFFNGYGGTEGQTTLTRASDSREIVHHTVGRPTCPYDVYKVTDLEGRELPSDTAGELLVKGPGVFTGYYRNREENDRCFTPSGFFRTGDVVKIDRQGNVTLLGRMKEMINRGGESISAVEVERLIACHPAVCHVAVVPMPDPEMGERVCAYIQAKPGARLQAKEILSYLRSRKASVLHLPERIEMIGAMPFTKAEKIDKRALCQDIAKKVQGLGPADL